ncbi:hypothetical protein CN878_19515 [Ochrobactrum sp. 695/2009]|nr:hypothetical protein CN881_22180 [Ochrobactrum sp. 721/2009]PJT16935.1 hypothetical protein CN880_11540 [Ochrobactrum sp. 720/2009]PJT18773.1 hypothetical protein CN879_20720 [Ochrobactrum sp. 715/2009]PJT27963.1 hypothetical protein CN878_19515 [Ochrobactrum sp. 695/2009]PJT31951.1 hypothetical protein CN877_23225 [Ochrobactrum sp. 689/2009]
MITVNIKKPSLLQRVGLLAKRPKVICLFAYRYDENLVPDLLENVAPFTDGWIAWDDTKRTELWYHEGQVRRALVDAARDNGADWVLCMDPDERLEIGAKEKIRSLISGDPFIIWGVHFRELYSADSYRVDGLWGQKKRYNLFAIHEGQELMNNNVHSGWYPLNSGYSMKMSDINLYHLKMIDPANRKARADLYNKVDTSGIQEIGYDYLADEDGMELITIAKDRMYAPFREKPLQIKAVC